MQEEIHDQYRIDQQSARDRIDRLVIGNVDALRRINRQRAFWALNLYQEAGEACGSFHAVRFLRSIPPHGEGRNKERSLEEASRRARGKIRRYGATNGFNRLGTLTYRGDGCHDP